MRHLHRRSLYFLVAFAFVLLGCVSLFWGGETARGHAPLQSVPLNGTIPPTATPPGTVPPPACPEDVKSPERGKIMVFLNPVAIYSGCVPQINSSGVPSETGFVPTLLYHDPESGFPEAVGYIGEVFAIFDYSRDELDRLVTILETFRCEDIGKPLEVCRQVNGIRISETGYKLMTASEMRSEAGGAPGLPNSAEQSSIVYLPFTSNE